MDDELHGMSFIKNKKPVAVANAWLKNEVQRFVMARQIGHITLHAAALVNSAMVEKRTSASATDYSRSNTIYKQFVAADLFAYYLLLPESLVTKHLVKERVDVIRTNLNTLVRNAAKAFAVTDIHMAVRLGQIGYT